jgi:hypothetical protein
MPQLGAAVVRRRLRFEEERTCTLVQVLPSLDVVWDRSDKGDPQGVQNVSEHLEPLFGS